MEPIKTQSEPQPNAGPDGLVHDLTEVLEDLTSDWDTGFSGSISADTRLIADLGFESIDVVHLIVTLEERFQRQDLPFESLLMRDGRYVSDLRVADLSSFLEKNLAA